MSGDPAANPAPRLLAAGADVEGLASAAQGCTACDLYRNATQAVFGEGPVPAEVMLVGEQPGDREDEQGHPFVGPAGRLLDRALEEAGLDRRRVYVTNVVKHFKWTARGKRRLHDKPDREEVAACLPWLAAELELVDPVVVVCLGATAAQALLGASFRVTRQGGQLLPWEGRQVLATSHPSAVLRAPGRPAARGGDPDAGRPPVGGEGSGGVLPLRVSPARGLARR